MEYAKMLFFRSSFYKFPEMNVDIATSHINIAKCGRKTFGEETEDILREADVALIAIYHK